MTHGRGKFSIFDEITYRESVEEAGEGMPKDNCLYSYNEAYEPNRVCQNYFLFLRLANQVFSFSVQFSYGCIVKELLVIRFSLVVSCQTHSGISNFSFSVESSISASTIPLFLSSYSSSSHFFPSVWMYSYRVFITSPCPIII